jgi:hypothetical protein
MLQSITIPRKDADFNEKQLMITTKTEQNLNQWLISPAWFGNVLLPARAGWTTAWAAWQNPVIRTPLITFEKTEARKMYEPLLRKLIEMLKGSPNITDVELMEMGIALNKGGGGHNPSPDPYPDFTIDTAILRRLGIHFSDHGSKSHAKPHGIPGAEIRWGFVTGMPKDVDELLHSAFDTRSPFTLEFSESDRGKTVGICLRWENTTGEKGPWSEILLAIIP